MLAVPLQDPDTVPAPCAIVSVIALLPQKEHASSTTVALPAPAAPTAAPEKVTFCAVGVSESPGLIVPLPATAAPPGSMATTSTTVAAIAIAPVAQATATLLVSTRTIVSLPQRPFDPSRSP